MKPQYKAVSAIISDGCTYLSDSDEPLELWLERVKLPEWEAIFGTGKNKETGILGLGPITRQHRLTLLDDRVEFMNPEGVKVTVPYDAIYCVAIRGEHVLPGPWFVHSESPGSVITYSPFKQI